MPDSAASPSSSPETIVAVVHSKTNLLEDDEEDEKDDERNVLLQDSGGIVTKLERRAFLNSLCRFLAVAVPRYFLLRGSEFILSLSIVQWLCVWT